MKLRAVLQLMVFAPALLQAQTRISSVIGASVLGNALALPYGTDGCDARVSAVGYSFRAGIKVKRATFSANYERLEPGDITCMTSVLTDPLWPPPNGTYTYTSYPRARYANQTLHLWSLRGSYTPPHAGFVDVALAAGVESHRDRFLASGIELHTTGALRLYAGLELLLLRTRYLRNTQTWQNGKLTFNEVQASGHEWKRAPQLVLGFQQQLIR